MTENLNIWSIVIPLLTLIVGYLLNILKGLFDFSRETRKEQIHKREGVYEEIFVKLFVVFQKYKSAAILISARYSTGNDKGKDISGNIENDVGPDFKELETLLLSKSLLIDADIFESFLRIPGMFRRRLLSMEKLEKVLDIKNIARFEIEHADLLWKYTLGVMNKVRKKIGLDIYPYTLLSFWDKNMTIADVLTEPMIGDVPQP